MTECPFCKADLSGRPAFCSRCGAKFDYEKGVATHTGSGGARWGILAPVEVAIPAMVAGSLLRAHAALREESRPEREAAKAAKAAEKARRESEPAKERHLVTLVFWSLLLWPIGLLLLVVQPNMSAGKKVLVFVLPWVVVLLAAGLLLPDEAAP